MIFEYVRWDTLYKVLTHQKSLPGSLVIESFRQCWIIVYSITSTKWLAKQSVLVASESKAIESAHQLHLMCNEIEMWVTC